MDIVVIRSCINPHIVARIPRPRHVGFVQSGLFVTGHLLPCWSGHSDFQQTRQTRIRLSSPEISRVGRNTGYRSTAKRFIESSPIVGPWTSTALAFCLSTSCDNNVRPRSRTTHCIYVLPRPRPNELAFPARGVSALFTRVLLKLRVTNSRSSLPILPALGYLEFR